MITVNPTPPHGGPDCRFVDHITHIVNMVELLSLIFLSWIFTFFLPANAGNFNWIWGNAFLTVDIVLTRSHWAPLFELMKIFILHWWKPSSPKSSCYPLQAWLDPEAQMMPGSCSLSPLTSTLPCWSSFPAAFSPLVLTKMTLGVSEWNKANGKKVITSAVLPEGSLDLTIKRTCVTNQSLWPGMPCSDWPDLRQMPHLEWERTGSPEETWDARTWSTVPGSTGHTNPGSPTSFHFFLLMSTLFPIKPLLTEEAVLGQLPCWSLIQAFCHPWEPLGLCPCAASAFLPACTARTSVCKEDDCSQSFGFWSPTVKTPQSPLCNIGIQSRGTTNLREISNFLSDF